MRAGMDRKVSIKQRPEPTNGSAALSPVAELLLHLARRLEQRGYAEGLTPAQWSLLRYVGGANITACTVTAFAAFHSVQQGSASQTVATLVKKRLLAFEPSEQDRRVKLMRLTAEGDALLTLDPLHVVEQAISSLAESERRTLADLVGKLLSRLSILPDNP